ncbi:MAG: hypothetical protein EOO09_12475 [Chitinophagaceae bacterium]|nr:MAG: hypothetical protein EOO09_12475 [Chitinophagaceae bacterium]
MIYEVGRPSNWLGSDTVTIVVSVQKPGYWEVKPVTISGLEFAGSGYLKDTGENILKIPVTGIPTTAGRFDFPLDMGALLCTPIVVIVPAGTFPPPPTTTYYYRATIGGKQYIEEVKPGNGIIAGSGVNGSNEVTFTASVGPDAYPYPIGKTSLSITKGTMFNFYSATIPQFLGFFSPAYYPYANGPSFSPFQNSNGLIVEWMDPQGNTWASYEGSGTQGGNASMKIASAVASPDPINYYVKTRIEFACRLYKQGTGEMMELTGGEFVGLFGPL